MVMCYTTLTSYMCVFVVHVHERMCICMRVSTCVDVSMQYIKYNMNIRVCVYIGGYIIVYVPCVMGTFSLLCSWDVDTALIGEVI